MEGDGEPGGPRLSKRFAGGKLGGGEVDYKTKAGTAWSHNYLNQKPWHPLSYPNQRRKWIAEQTNAQRDRRAEEVAREFAQEQEFFRQTALLSDKEKEKIEMMKAVSFMYLRPPGYNAESAKAAELADEEKNVAGSSAPLPSTVPEPAKKKPKPKDVFGRALPTEEDFEVLKNAPKMETGVAGRVKPFAVEIRNVKCFRCGKHGHQSGDRECPLKDAIMPNEQSRLVRDDPLTAIQAQTGSSAEAPKWELKQKPGLSPPHGGFDLDDPNQQIVAADDIFDEYGGFLGGDDIPALLSNFKSREGEKKRSKKKKHKDLPPPTSNDYHEKSSSKRRTTSSASKERGGRHQRRAQSESEELMERGEDRRHRRRRNQSESEDLSDGKEDRRSHRRRDRSELGGGEGRRHRRRRSLSESDDSWEGEEDRQRHRRKHRSRLEELPEGRKARHDRGRRNRRESDEFPDGEEERQSCRRKNRIESEESSEDREDQRRRQRRVRRKPSSSSSSSDDEESNRRRRTNRRETDGGGDKEDRRRRRRNRRRSVSSSSSSSESEDGRRLRRRKESDHRRQGRLAA